MTENSIDFWDSNLKEIKTKNSYFEEVEEEKTIEGKEEICLFTNMVEKFI